MTSSRCRSPRSPTAVAGSCGTYSSPRCGPAWPRRRWRRRTSRSARGTAQHRHHPAVGSAAGSEIIRRRAGCTQHAGGGRSDRSRTRSNPTLSRHIGLIMSLRNVKVVTSTAAMRRAATAALQICGINGFRRGPEPPARAHPPRLVRCTDHGQQRPLPARERGDAPLAQDDLKSGSGTGRFRSSSTSTIRCPSARCRSPRRPRGSAASCGSWTARSPRPRQHRSASLRKFGPVVDSSDGDVVRVAAEARRART